VDKWITCEQLPGDLAAPHQPFQDPARQNRPARDESREKSDGARALGEQRGGLVRRVDAAGGDDLHRIAETLSGAAHAAGFADAAHLSRTARTMFGLPPSVLQMNGPLSVRARQQQRHFA